MAYYVRRKAYFPIDPFWPNAIGGASQWTDQLTLIRDDLNAVFSIETEQEFNNFMAYVEAVDGWQADLFGGSPLEAIKVD